ncbi:MAG TPA: LPS assembly lipoprotein LptE [Steroidobacteraceae bacterium]|nr:LPS assembly lipoprotein LptE [Steroidobacteraceae bacterium]
MRRALQLTLAALALALFTSGCGFHLQGRTPLPQSMKVPCVIARDRQSEFVQNLRKALQRSGAQLTEHSTEASAIVRIDKDEVTRIVLAVSPNNVPAEYELTYTVSFTVIAAGKDVLPAQEVSATRDFSFDEHALLAKDNEEQILREGLAHDLVDVVMRRLSSL